MKIKKLFAVSILAWASLPLNGIFNPEDGFVGCDRQEKFYPVGRQKTKKAETAVNATAPAYKNSTQNFLDFYIKIGIQKFLRAFISNL